MPRLFSFRGFIHTFRQVSTKFSHGSPSWGDIIERKLFCRQNLWDTVTQNSLWQKCPPYVSSNPTIDVVSFVHWYGKCRVLFSSFLKCKNIKRNVLSCFDDMIFEPIMKNPGNIYISLYCASYSIFNKKLC